MRGKTLGLEYSLMLGAKPVDFSKVEYVEQNPQALVVLYKAKSTDFNVGKNRLWHS